MEKSGPTIHHKHKHHPCNDESAQTFFTPTRWLLRASGHRLISRETDTVLYRQKTSWADDVEDLGEHLSS